MKHLIRAVLISLLFSGVAFGEEVSDPDPEGLLVDESVIASEPFVPGYNFVICNQGKCAEIDFSGDEIVYSGELEVAESAKIFFNYFGELCPERSPDETKKE